MKVSLTLLVVEIYSDNSTFICGFLLHYADLTVLREFDISHDVIFDMMQLLDL